MTARPRMSRGGTSSSMRGCTRALRQRERAALGSRERIVGELLDSRCPARAIRALSCGMTAGHHRQLVHAEADQHRHGRRIRGQPAAHGHRQSRVLRRCCTTARSAATRPDAARRCAARKLGMAAIHRERVLRRDRWCRWTGNRPRAPCRRRATPRPASRSWRRARWRRSVRSRRAARRASRARMRISPASVIIGSRMRHCRARLHRSMRAQLRREQIGPPQARAHAAQTQRRILLGRQRQIGNRLVAADIERADRQAAGLPSAAQSPGTAQLLVLVRRRDRARGTGTRCAAGRSLPRRCAAAISRLGERAEIRKTLDSLAVRRAALGRCRLLLRGAPPPPTGELACRVFDLERTGLDPQSRGLGIEHDRPPVRNAQSRRAQPHQHRQLHGSGNDGHVGGRPAAGQGDTGELLANPDPTAAMAAAPRQSGWRPAATSRL